MYCEQCGAKNEEGTKFCISCGASMAGDDLTAMTEQLSKVQNPKSKWLKKTIIGVAAIAILGGAGILGYNFINDNFGGGGSGFESHPVVYAKDSILYMKNANKKEAYPLTESYGYNDNDYSYNNRIAQEYGNIQMSTDGKIIFFADDIEGSEFKLYYRKTGQKIPRGDGADEKGIRLAAGVTRYKPSPNGDFVVYQKGDRLYISDLKEEHSVSSGVSMFYLSDDLQKIIFRKDGGDIYICGTGTKDQPEKIETDTDTIISPNGEYKKIYYKKDNSIYVKELGKDKVKVASDVENAFQIGDSYFFTKKNVAEQRFNDLFNDDCAAEDAQITSPSYSDFRTQDEDGHTTTDYDAYNEARDKYNEKRARDDVREYYAENPQSVTTYTLYRIADNEGVEIASGLLSAYVGNIFTQKASEDSKILLSTVTSTSDARNKINDLKNNVENKTNILKADGTVIELADYDEEYFTDVHISEDEKYFYCIEDPGNNLKGTLNRYSITETGLSSKEKLYDDTAGYTVYGDSVIIYSDDKTIGIYDGGKYTELSDSTNWRYTFENGVLYYYDQYSTTNSIGNLMRYKNGKKEQLDIDVHDFVLRGSDDCYYIKDYSTNSSRGELYQKKGGGKPKLIDSDVSYIVY